MPLEEYDGLTGNRGNRSVFYLAMPRSMQDLPRLGNQTCAPCIGSMEILTTEPPWKSLVFKRGKDRVRCKFQNEKRV